MSPLSTLLPDKRFHGLRAEWGDSHPFELGLAAPDGSWIHPPLKPCVHGGSSESNRRQAIAESQRWGEPFVYRCCSDACLLFAVPLMLNERLVGGIIVSGIELDMAERQEGEPLDPVSRAVRDLMAHVESENLTNSSHLYLKHLSAARERDRAEAIHAVKSAPYESLRALYIREETELHSAVKRGDRKVARSVINRILVAAYSIGRNNLDVLKSLLLEMVVLVGRTAVDAGANPASLLLAQVPAFRRLGEIQDDEDLSMWLTSILELILDTVRDAPGDADENLAARAVKYMEDNLDKELTRDGVAERAGVSPSHFSRLMHRLTGKTFSETLLNLRVLRARELLVRSHTPLAGVASECGFADQSHFTKVFGRMTGVSPGEYRRRGTAERASQNPSGAFEGR